MIKPAVLTIAGSDSSGGAGIQADLKAMLANDVFGMSAICAVTAQNTTGVRQIAAMSPEMLTDQLDAVFTDIYPSAVKIGMTFDASLIEVIAERLTYYRAKNIVLDPVMVATSGARLLKEDAIEALCRNLVPLADLITPNIPEAEILSGVGHVDSRQAMMEAAQLIADRYDVAVLLKGGHLESDEEAADLLYQPDGTYRWYLLKRIDNPNTHGTGCTLSSAIASNLAKGCDLEESIDLAKQYLEHAIAAGLDLGKGAGPLWHGVSSKDD